MKEYNIIFALENSQDMNDRIPQYIKMMADTLGGATLPPANKGAYTMSNGELVIEPSFTLIGYGEESEENINKLKVIAEFIKESEKQESVLFIVKNAPDTQFV